MKLYWRRYNAQYGMSDFISMVLASESVDLRKIFVQITKSLSPINSVSIDMSWSYTL